ncbi:hypothetical protein [Bradyrhizobium japonicum]|uniref:hypothetical protein n=1 Tax=Bradyrhizobium japonicum TaxID=375 RepID=UPI002714628B|nr:hypothetical protein [Bradyrhizobium japonicum]WLB54697.1 hypothetical protein QIH94_01415 [Bradyrhizobium japonicum]WLB63429.1 hypothetical protein QIH96_44465 [Bradyrhizobium japonicum]
MRIEPKRAAAVAGVRRPGPPAAAGWRPGADRPWPPDGLQGPASLPLHAGRRHWAAHDGLAGQMTLLGQPAGHSEDGVAVGRDGSVRRSSRRGSRTTGVERDRPEQLLAGSFINPGIELMNVID